MAKAAQTNSKRQKFEELVARRVPSVRKSIAVLRHLTNHNAYDFKETDWKKILGVIREDVDALERAAMSKGGKEADLSFSL